MTVSDSSAATSASTGALPPPLSSPSTTQHHNHHLHRSNSHSHINKPMTWMQCLAQFIIVSTLVACVVGIIGYSVDLYRHGKQKHFIGWFSSAGFVLLTIPISIRLIVMHLTHWNAPHIQKYVVRIIWMIPIYSIESWLALRFKGVAIYLETLRECYEAYVILCFMYYLMALLGDEHHINNLRQKFIAGGNKGADFGRHSWPLNYCFAPWSTGSELLQNCKFGVFQYVLIKNIFAVMVWTMHMNGHYNENKYNWDELYLYQCMVSNASQLWALYCLLMFYYATKDELTPWRPVGKFLCVKSVVFFTWWQSITIEFLIHMSHGRLFKSDGRSDWTVNEISKGLQDYLICIEMFLASIAFTIAFSHRDYILARSKRRDDFEGSKPFLSAFLQSSMPDDFLADIRRFTGVGTKRASSATISDEDSHSSMEKVSLVKADAEIELTGMEEGSGSDAIDSDEE